MISVLKTGPTDSKCFMAEYIKKELSELRIKDLFFTRKTIIILTLVALMAGPVSAQAAVLFSENFDANC